MENLSENSLKSFRMTLPFRDFNRNFDKRISSVNFSSDGQTLVSSSNKDLIEIYNCDRGLQVDTIPVRKYGCYFVDFLQTTNDVVVISSTRNDDVIRALNIEKRSYLTYFEGHTNTVTALCVNRQNNCFLSSGSDKTVRLWDTRSPRCEGVTHVGGDVVATCSDDGEIIAASIDSKTIELYDMRSLEMGHFVKWELNKEYNGRCIDVKFSRDSSTILCSTNGPSIFSVESVLGNMLKRYSSRKNALGLPIIAAFNADSKYVFSGSSDGHLLAWDAMTGSLAVEIESQHAEGITSVRCNPVYSLVATGSSFVAFWTPET